MRRSRGFTLLELLIVVSLVGIMSGFAIVSSAGLLQSRRFDSAVQELALAARKTRQNAQNRAEAFTFEFTLHDPALNTSPADPPDRYAVYRGRVRPSAPDWRPLPDRIWIYRTNVGGPPYQWTFNERGTIAPGQMGTIVLQDASRLDPGLVTATSLTDYLRRKETNPNGLSRGIVMSTYLGKVTVVSTGTL